MIEAVRRRWRGAAVVVAGWALLLGLWLLLVDALDPPELIAGAAAAAIAAAAGALAVHSHVDLGTGLPVLRRAWRVPPEVARDSLVVLGAAILHLLRVRAMRGTFATLPAGPEACDPDATGRRGAVLFTSSLAPDTVAIGFDPAARTLVVHHLVRRR